MSSTCSAGAGLMSAPWTPASRQASPTGPPSPPGRSAPVRGDVAPEAGVIGAGATMGGGVEALCGAAAGSARGPHAPGPGATGPPLDDGAAHSPAQASRLCLRRAPPPRPAHSPIHRSRRRHSLCGSRRHSRHRLSRHGRSLRHPVPLGRLQRVRRTALARTASIPEPRRRRARADRSSSTSPASERFTPSERIQAMRSSSWSSE